MHPKMCTYDLCKKKWLVYCITNLKFKLIQKRGLKKNIFNRGSTYVPGIYSDIKIGQFLTKGKYEYEGFENYVIGFS